jgi:hypothetical protein
MIPKSTGSGQNLSRNIEISAFAGCTRLLEQYRHTGLALLNHEGWMYGALGPSSINSREFSHGVAFVPVEVLESYLDDLLDLGVSDESLFIKKPRPSKRAVALLAVCLLALLGAVFSLTVGSVEIPIPALLLVTFLAGIGSTFYFLPRTKILRRFGFATVVSREIAARRGHDRTDLGGFATRLLIRDLWRVRPSGRASHLPPHPARVVARYYH